MPFVEPLFLWFGAAVAVPIIIHLLFRRRSRRVELGTLRFLRVVLEQNAQRRRLKRWVLLSLRVAGILLLAALFARPFLEAREPSAGKDRFVAILIDQSASMQLKDRDGRLIDQALDQARRIIREAGDDTRVELAFFDHMARPAGGPQSASGNARRESAASRDELLALAAPDKLFSATNYGAALAWAHDVCLNAPYRRKELHIFTDLQRSGLDWTDVEPMPPDVEVHLVDLGRSAVSNLAITGLHTARLLVRPGDPVRITATIVNASPFPLEKAPVVLSLETASRKPSVLRDKISLEPGASGAVSFDAPPLTEGLWSATVRLEAEDELPFDNQRFLALLSAPPVPVLLLDGDPRESALLSETYYLESALRLAQPGETWAEATFAPVSAPFGEGARLPDLKGTRIVVLANVAEVNPADAQRLKTFVEEGGGLMVFTGDKVQSAGYRSLDAAGLTVGAIEGTQRATDLPLRFEQWDGEHPLFEPFADPQHGDLRRLAFSACTRIAPAEGVQVVARFRGGEPALLERRAGAGHIVWFTSACDRDWGDWPRSRLYLPLAHQMLAHLAGLTGGGPVRESLLEAATRSAPNALPGVHKRDGFTEVINVSPRESETERCTPRDFAERFQIALSGEEPVQAAARADEAAPSASTDLRDDEIWHWFVFGLLGLLVTESFVANRTAA